MYMMESPETIRTLDNVPLELPLAGVASRGLAFAIDSLLLAVVSTVWFLVIMAVTGGTGLAVGWLWGIGLVGVFLLQWGYFVFFEIKMRGGTPGKGALKLRVVSSQGGTPSPSALVVRNVLRMFPDMFVGVILMAVDPMSRRAGDRLAGTLVIHEGGERTGPALGKIPQGWGGPEVAVVEAYLERAAILEPAVSMELGQRIYHWIERDYPEMLEGIERSGRHPAAVLHDVFQVERL
jgi:uncharacterized RDD family membrane protein YckC